MNVFSKGKAYGMAEEYAISYLQTRRMIGIFGFALPVLLLAGSFVPNGPGTVLGSISQYYGTNMRDFFVGILCAIALFLFSYKGYNRIDSVLASLAAVFALGVAFFPVMSPCVLVQYLHLTFAALLFITLAIISLCIFTLTQDNTPAVGRKRIRNTMYRVCGWLMLGCIAVLFLYHLVLVGRFGWLDTLRPVFALETLALFAFGTSWLIKGRTLWKDL